MYKHNTRRLRIGIAQVNTTVGDFTGNIDKITNTIKLARSSGVDILTFPELAICGYPPEDLLFKPEFIADNLKSLEKITKETSGISIIIGFVDGRETIYNAAAIIHDGKLAGVYHKIYLPNYGVFDEDRYFQAGRECPVYIISGINIGVNICEDIWYEDGPTRTQAFSGAELIINISASPYHFGKGNVRERMVKSRASDNLAIIALTNLIGGQDELVFDGNSLIADEKGKLLARGKQFEEDLMIADLDIESVSRARLDNVRWRKEAALYEEQGGVISEKVLISDKPLKTEKPRISARKVKVNGFPEEVYNALVLGTRDYIRKNGFNQVLIGLSGGLDSSLVATVAVDALGKENVVGVAMPSQYSSPGSVSDAELLAHNLGIKLLTIPIEDTYKSYMSIMADSLKGTEPDVTEENLQARIRGNILMALSNKFGWLVLTTGNKSEMATGYSTLYGDMAGGFAVIKDIPKTMAYQLAEYRNSLEKRDLIPESVITKAPSAELRPDQKDTDTLPPYELLDPILTAYVEEDKSVRQIVNMGYDEAVVKQVARLVDTSEYKRRQAPPGIKITPRAFGRDRRLPITSKFRKY
ncbi:MAG TPA: NAD+ synthase [Dehalococcoidia bacterium]|nr:NAD+ synthase [Dehalococcoidia bacterium]